MLLTVFYVAATWMQSRRLGALKKKISQFVSDHSSIVFYKISSGKNDSEENIAATTCSSPFCKNKEKAMIGEVLHFTTNIRSCVLLPEQIINVDKWVTFANDSPFPLRISSRKTILKDQRLFLLMEANNVDSINLFDNKHSYSLSQIGILRAWRAEDTLGLIIESDIDHFTKISSLFLSFPIFVESGFQISRIQTVTVEGQPCFLIREKKDLPKSPSYESQISCESSISEWYTYKLNAETSPDSSKNQMEFLRRLSRCADLTATNGSSVLIPDDETTSIMPGNTGLKLDTPSNIPVKIGEEETVKRRKHINTENSPANGAPKERKIRSPTPSILTSEFATASCDSSAAVSAQSTPSRQDFYARKNTLSSLYSVCSASTLSLKSFSSGKSKPPNVLIYTESQTTTENIKVLLHETLHKHKYTIYSVTSGQLANSVWATNCLLLVICGNVPRHLEPILTSYLVLGGKLLCLCSSFLHTLLPTFRTAEVRERELVHFSYGRWQRVRLMHHIFCYQNSPSRNKFSGDSDDASSNKDRVSPVPQTPTSVEVIDSNGVSHTLYVQVLGVEETWQTPSLLLAHFTSPGGRAVFSQVHLELDPSIGIEEDEEKELKHSAQSRKEIIKDILSTHLGLETCTAPGSVTYTVGYFLGMHETKLKFLEKTKPLNQDGVIKLGTIGLKFCIKRENLPTATASLLPILVHSCPRDFSTLDYFENLGTRSIGRLVIYSEVLGSSMDVVNGELTHGLAVVPSQQTSGKGRTSNQWLSPPGCAMFSLQVHFPMNSYMGRHPSVLQHVVSVAIASSLTELGPEYKKAFDIHLKWPNDLFTRDNIKLGGIIVNCFSGRRNLVCNIGSGINLDNDLPTTCLNKLIEEYNKDNNAKLKKLSREKLLAIIFTQLESILDKVEEGNFKYAEELYYKHWLHGGAEVRVLDSSGIFKQVKILGIDEFGFLRVQEPSGNTFTVHPDGNSFDMMEGLIAPKLK